ncbi:hypothetical protein [Marinobacter orientalis]|uniref:Uncharacterized protein n=1 Tax=Marinobacter orientalis TaxID=1928859 RepID=A0A7Y0RDJ7_9GAMM|nr:hypothetical protein [Marinobacter orientalis]NMT64252.1 hypothetical protein [Marinobacter orientalis]TGX49474.1 hypothetical protein DIT72_11665 [Marinobacter orientalis]
MGEQQPGYQQQKGSREGFGRDAMVSCENVDESAFLHYPTGLTTPVVEVTGDSYWLALGNGLHQVAEHRELPLTMVFTQAQMNTASRS